MARRGAGFRLIQPLPLASGVAILFCKPFTRLVGSWIRLLCSAGIVSFPVNRLMVKFCLKVLERISLLD